MFRKNLTRNSLFVSVICLSIILLTNSYVMADPLVITGSNQMTAGGTQTLTVTGGSGTYQWIKSAGGGSINTTQGSSVDYTAGLLNQNCVNNPTVCVQDSTGQRSCIQIAVLVNLYSGYIAYDLKDNSLPLKCGSPYGCMFQYYHYDCAGNRLGIVGATYCGYPNQEYCVNCSIWAPPPQCVGIWCDYVGGIYDQRDSSMKNGGCCPAAMLGRDDSIPGPNKLGKSCPVSVNIGSSANARSGNLYQTQDVGILTLRYNSLDGTDGILGVGWTHNYNVTMSTIDASTLKLRDADGNIIYFRLSGSTYYPEAISSDDSTVVKNSNGTYTRTEKNGTVQQFNTSGYLTSIRDRNNNATTLSYSGSCPSSITDPNGRITSITNTSGRITAITDPMGRTYTITYNGSHHITAITDPLGNAWQYTYNSYGKMLTKRDPLNRTTTYTYDSTNRTARVLTATDPEGKVRTMSYTERGTTTITEKDGGLWTYTYDPIYTVVTAKTDPLGYTTTYAYDNKRNLIKKTEHDGSYTSYTYDANNNLLTTTDPLGNTTTYTYNSLNLVLSVTDPKSAVTSYTYDTTGNLLTVTEPSGAVTSFVYDTKGNPTSITDSRGKITTLAYDTHNNLTSVTDPLSHVTSFTYDAVGNLLTSTDPLSNVTQYTYNGLNQRTQMTDPLGNVTQYLYDFMGNIERITDAASNATNYAYNYRGQATQITDALNNITQMTYGPTGCGTCGGAEKLTSLVDALSHNTTYTYDTAGRLVAETDPLSRATAFTYNSKGNLVSKTKPDGRTITYVYDAADRLLEKHYPDSTVAYFSYDQNGNMTGASNQNISYTFSYDSNNRLTGVTDSNSRTVSYQYDLAGNRTSMTSPENLITTYTYNDVGRLTGIANFMGSFGLSHDNAGRRTGLTYPNGASAAYTYDANGNLTRVRHLDSGLTAFSDVNYTYNNLNNRSVRTDTQGSASYTYDAISRLTVNSLGENYSYDAVGNRLTGPLATDTMTYDAGNEQLNINSILFTYDLNGNRNQKTDSGTVTTYTYDDENRLIQVTVGTDVFTYAYDPFGRRISKTINGVTTSYVYDQSAIIAAYDGSGNVIARYTHGLNIDEPLAVQQGTVNYFHHADGLGSIVALTNASGSAVQTYSYDSFGNTTISDGISQPYAYTAREYDTETGLYFYRARYYDPRAGRFLTKDPIGFAGRDVNLYAYVGNNPIIFADPLGLLVYATYDKATGRFNVTDLDTGQQVSISAESGGKPWGAPIPLGWYEILDHPDPDFLRLDAIDSAPRNDVHDPTGRSHLRLHKPGNTTGCIAAKKADEWKKVRDLIRNTKTTTVPDNAKPWWKLWGDQEYIRNFGTLIVK